jgi:pimeloyl-ACP methyl ester carboxylesterase
MTGSDPEPTSGPRPKAIAPRPLSPRHERDASNTCNTVAQSASVILVSMAGPPSTGQPRISQILIWESCQTMLEQFRPHGLASRRTLVANVRFSGMAAGATLQSRTEEHRNPPMSGASIDLMRLHWRQPSRSVIANSPPGTRLLELSNAVIRVREVGAGSQTILLTPDAPVVLENYNRLIDLLVPHARVICFEFPGCGFSYPRFGFNFKLSHYVNIVREVMDRLVVERGTLAFTCVNALVAMAFARQHPSRIERLALAQVAAIDQMEAFVSRIDIKILGVPVLATPVLGQVMMMARRSAVAHAWFRAALPKGFDKELIWGDARKVFQAGGQFCLASIVQGLTSIQADEVTTDVPSSVVWGLADRTHRATRKESIQTHLAKARLHMLGDRGHCPDIEAPEAYSQLLLTQHGN